MGEHAPANRPGRLRRFWRWLVGDAWLQSLARLAVVGLAVAVAALLFVSAGFVPIAASQPHWPITRFLLHFAMIRSVQTHALAVNEPPPEERPLSRDAMVLKGAGHYASGCLACHGAPGHPRAEVVRHMEPAPPYLPPRIDRWSDEELFWIARHGIKYTAMPAWPSHQRDDEVWAMVAFLRELPGLEPQAFRQLAYGAGAARMPTGGASLDQLERGTGATGGAASRLETVVADCARCHGRDGNGRGTGAFPALAGQSEHYLLASLQAYAAGERHSGVMQPVAAGLDASEMRALAGYYARLAGARGDGALAVDGGAIAAEAAPTGGRGAGDARRPGIEASAARGERLARQGDAAARIPSCVECHGPGDDARNPRYPRLAGLHPDYIALQLQLFRKEQRGGTGYAHIMRTVARSLEPQDTRDLAAWYGSLPAGAASARSSSSSVTATATSSPPSRSQGELATEPLRSSDRNP
ncbi:c-type cytochrome [Lysobacter zhanggongensis]|uniref:C-type cytochrome n=1 Tax=Lysobacter zhanggongensis TaxID=1774951 RepID=A0ABU7YNZ2_9GAMM